jgi:hypothetical protein
MKLSNKAIEAISNRRIMLALALELSFTELWIKKLIEANKDNGHLTTVTALGVIRRETGLSNEDILEASDVKEPQDNRVNL